jgi:hypothetical protein
VTISLTGDLTVEQLVRVARGHEAVELAPEAVARIEAGRAVVEHVLELDTPVYGVTTGVGARKSVRVDPADSAEFNRMILLNHLVAQGDPAPEDVVRGTLVRLANGLAKGTAGVRLELAERLVRALNEGPLPRVRTLGSVGQADLPAMADVAHELVGGTQFAAKEGLALLNNNAFSTAVAALAVADLARLLDTTDIAGALDLEAFAANVSMLHPVLVTSGTTEPRGISRIRSRFAACLRCTARRGTRSTSPSSSLRSSSTRLRRIRSSSRARAGSSPSRTSTSFRSPRPSTSSASRSPPCSRRQTSACSSSCRRRSPDSRSAWRSATA